MGDGSPFAFWFLSFALMFAGYLASCLPWRSLIALPGMAKSAPAHPSGWMVGSPCRRHLKRRGRSRCFRAVAAWRGAKAPAPNLFPGFPATLLSFAQRLARLPVQAFFPIGCVAALCRTFCQRFPSPAVLSNRSAKGCHLLSGSKGETHGGVWGESPKPDGETDGASNLAARGAIGRARAAAIRGYSPQRGRFPYPYGNAPAAMSVLCFVDGYTPDALFFFPHTCKKPLRTGALPVRRGVTAWFVCAALRRLSWLRAPATPGTDTPPLLPGKRRRGSHWCSWTARTAHHRYS